MIPKSSYARPALAWLERIEFHLTNAQSASLAANDAADYETLGQSIRFIAAFAYIVQRDERERKRKKREKLGRLRQLRNANDPTLERRLADCDLLAA